MTAPVGAATPLSTWRVVRHLTRFAVARHRVPILVMVGLELLRAAYVEWTLQLAPVDIGERLTTAAGEVEVYLLDLAIWAGAWVVTAMVVQGAHPGDDRAFWRTRPLAPHAVALATVALLGLVFVAVPALINSVRLAAYGAPISAHVAATVQIAVTAGGALVPAWALAIATRTLPAFLAAAGALLVFSYLSITGRLFFLGSPGWVSFGSSVSLADWSRSSALGWAVALGLTALALVVLVVHYHLRRTWMTVAVGSALLVATAVLPATDQAASPPPDLTALVAAPLRPPAGLWTGAGRQLSDGARLAFLSGRLALPALPRDVSAGVFIDRARVLVDGRDVAASGFDQCCLGFGPTGVASAQPDARVDGESWSEELAQVPASAIPEMLATPVTLDADATIVFMRHRLVASLPLTPGAAIRGEGYLVEVLSTIDREPGAVALLRISRFPRLSRHTSPVLSFFYADPARRRVVKSPPPFFQSIRPAATPIREWVQGRRWAGRYHVMLLGGALSPDRRLLIVESHRAGESRARVVASGAPVAPSRPVLR